MHELTIATDDTTNTTAHHDFDDAFGFLMSHVIAQDLYLHTIWSTPRTTTAFKLVHLDETARQPRLSEPPPSPLQQENLLSHRIIQP